MDNIVKSNLHEVKFNPCKMRFTSHQNDSLPGADPGFPEGRGANPPGEAPTYNFARFSPKNCMKIRNFWSVGGCPPWIHHCLLPDIFSSHFAILVDY